MPSFTCTFSLHCFEYSPIQHLWQDICEACMAMCEANQVTGVDASTSCRGPCGPPFCLQKDAPRPQPPSSPSHILLSCSRQALVSALEARLENEARLQPGAPAYRRFSAGEEGPTSGRQRRSSADSNSASVGWSVVGGAPSRAGASFDF